MGRRVSPCGAARRIIQAISKKIPNTTPRQPNTAAIDGSPLGFLLESWKSVLFEGVSGMCDSRFSGNEDAAGLLSLAEASAE